MDKSYVKQIKIFTNICRLGIPQNVSEEIDDLFASQNLGGDNCFVSETPNSLDEIGYHKTADFIRENNVKDDETILIENPQ